MISLQSSMHEHTFLWTLRVYVSCSFKSLSWWKEMPQTERRVLNYRSNKDNLKISARQQDICSFWATKSQSITVFVNILGLCFALFILMFYAAKSLKNFFHKLPLFVASSRMCNCKNFPSIRKIYWCRIFRHLTSSFFLGFKQCGATRVWGKEVDLVAWHAMR